jgi:endonuclease/exonuclease/phosphatase family metal-dependent hydrolase
VKKKFLLLFVLLLSTTLHSQNEVRVMSYNLLNYPNGRSGGVDISSIEPYYKKIINSINPDILVVVEMLTPAGVNRFKQNVLGNSYLPATVAIKGNGIGGNDCAIYYKNSVFDFVRTIQYPTLTRDICEFTLVHHQTNDTLIIFGVHLKANDLYGDNNPNILRRSTEIDSLRKQTKQIKGTANYLIAGDFNILDSYEPAFIKLLDSSLPGYFYDPLQSFGIWNNNSLFSNTHSYSPTKLSTRFDMILLSQGIIDEGGVDYIAGSFKIFGNDSEHFNKSILDGPNYWFTDNYDLGLAATQASDHLPVFADFSFGVQTSSISFDKNIPTNFSLEQNYPNPFNPETTIKYRLPKTSFVTLKIYDVLGREIAVLVNENQTAGIYSSKFNVSDNAMSSNVYFYQLITEDLIQTKKMLLLK